MYSVHNTLDIIAVIVWDSGFNNSFHKLSNRDNQDSKIGEGRTTPKNPMSTIVHLFTVASEGIHRKSSDPVTIPHSLFPIPQTK